MPVQSSWVAHTCGSLVLVPLLSASEPTPLSVPSISVSLVRASAWLSGLALGDVSVSLTAQLAPVLQCAPALCHCWFPIPLPSCCVSIQSPDFPFSMCCSRRCTEVSPQLFLQKGKAHVPLPGSPRPSPALQQHWVLIRPFM